MTILERHIEEAVRSAVDMSWFAGYLRGMLDAEVPQPTIETALMRIYDDARAAGDERIVDLMLDGMDLLTGWCGPGFGVGTASTA